MAIKSLKNEYLAKTYMNRESMTPKLEVMFTVIISAKQKSQFLWLPFFVLHSGKAMTKNDHLRSINESRQFLFSPGTKLNFQKETI